MVRDDVIRPKPKLEFITKLNDAVVVLHAAGTNIPGFDLAIVANTILLMRTTEQDYSELYVFRRLGNNWTHNIIIHLLTISREALSSNNMQIRYK